MIVVQTHYGQGVLSSTFWCEVPATGGEACMITPQAAHQPYAFEGKDAVGIKSLSRSGITSQFSLAGAPARRAAYCSRDVRTVGEQLDFNGSLAGAPTSEAVSRQ